MRGVLRRPSPAMVVAVFALIAAIGGTAVAGVALNKKSVNKIITKRAPGLSVGDSAKLGGQPAGAYASASSEPYHEVGTPGAPVFQNGWANYGAGLSTAAFYKDSLGIVHLKGVITNAGNNSVAFTLPPGYRPTQDLSLPSHGSGPTAANIDVQPTGEVGGLCVAAPCNPTLDGLTFRAS